MLQFQFFFIFDKEDCLSYDFDFNVMPILMISACQGFTS